MFLTLLVNAAQAIPEGHAEVGNPCIEKPFDLSALSALIAERIAGGGREPERPGEQI